MRDQKEREVIKRRAGRGAVSGDELNFLLSRLREDGSRAQREHAARHGPVRAVGQPRGGGGRLRHRAFHAWPARDAQNAAKHRCVSCLDRERTFCAVCFPHDGCATHKHTSRFHLHSGASRECRSRKEKKKDSKREFPPRAPPPALVRKVFEEKYRLSRRHTRLWEEKTKRLGTGSTPWAGSSLPTTPTPSCAKSTCRRAASRLSFEKT